MSGSFRFAGTSDGENSLSYKYVDVQIDRERRLATWTIRAPETDVPDSVEAILAQGDAWWPLQMARELDDAILQMRTNRRLREEQR